MICSLIFKQQIPHLCTQASSQVPAQQPCHPIQHAVGCQSPSEQTKENHRSYSPALKAIFKPPLRSI